jgi:hypothetical protein
MRAKSKHGRYYNCTDLVADNVKSNETRGSVFLKYNEGDDFCNMLVPNDIFLILVKFLPDKGYCSGTVHSIHLVWIELEFIKC